MPWGVLIDPNSLNEFKILKQKAGHRQRTDDIWQTSISELPTDGHFYHISETSLYMVHFAKR